MRYMKKFVHLHVHSMYSPLDGMASIRELYEAARRNSMPGFAITDHGNLNAMPELFALAKEYPDIKPIAGCEFYLTEHKRWFHLILLAKNEVGYRNLWRLSEASITEGRHGSRATISHELVKKYHEGLICTSACLGGEVAQAILEYDFDKAKSAIKWYKNVFGDDFYLEIDIHKNNIENRIYPKQERVARWIRVLGEKLNVKVIAANDVHYIDKTDAEVHDLILLKHTGEDPNDPNRLRFTGEEWFKSQEDMEIVFSKNSNVQFVWNTMEIFNKIENYDLDTTSAQS